MAENQKITTICVNNFPGRDPITSFTDSEIPAPSLLHLFLRVVPVMERGSSSDSLDDGEAARAQRMIQAQFEALGIDRRQRISETDFKENLRAIPKADSLDVHRRVNLKGTPESRVSTGVKELLSGWSSAYFKLSHDDAAKDGLQDINAGQTHRANLAQRVAQPSNQYNDESGNFSNLTYRDGNSSRGGRARGGGRGGGRVGSRASRHGPARVPIGLGTTHEASKSLRAADDMSAQGDRLVVTSSPAHPNGQSASLPRHKVNVLLPKEPIIARSMPDQPPPPVANPARRPTAKPFKISLADPETFMAAARRNKPSKESIETTSTPATVNGANSNPPKHEALPLAPRPDEVLPQASRPSKQAVHVENRQEESKLGSQEDSLLKSIPQPASTSKVEVAPINASGATSVPRQGDSFEADQHEASNIQNNEKSDAETLRQMKSMAAFLSGGLRDQILLQISSLEASATSRAALPSSANNTEQKPTPNPSVSAVVPAPIETAEPAIGLGIESQAPTIQPTVVPSHSRTPSSVKSSKTASIQPFFPTSLGIKAVKQKVIKVKAIFGEHIQKDHFHARARLESVASSVASTIDVVPSGSADSSHLTIQEPRNGLQSATTIAEPTPAVESTITRDTGLPDSTRQVDIVPIPQYVSQSTKDTAAARPAVISTPQEDSKVIRKHLMRETPRIFDSSVTRQYLQDPKAKDPEFASTNPFSSQSGSSRRPRSSSKTMSTTQQRPLPPRDTSPLAEPFNTAPYRWEDETPARAARGDNASFALKPKVPDFLKTPITTGQDVGAAARRQYDPTYAGPQHRVLEERTNQQARAPAATTAPTMLDRPTGRLSSTTGAGSSQGSVASTSENKRPSAKKDPWAPARRSGLL